MPPTWLTVLAWISLASAFACTGLIAVDIFARGYRQHMWIMDVVWPLTALYSGPLAWLAYRRWGRVTSPRYRQQSGIGSHHPFSVSVGISDTHCGAGCALGDVISEWVLFAVGATIAGVALWPEYILDFVLAFVFGIAFQYFTIAPMRQLGFREGVIAALKSDTLSVMAFEIGLFGWMALSYFVFFTDPHLRTDHAAYWFQMQIGMILGFLTSYPANRWLIRHGIKEEM
ncbi:MAG TPA: DUF4396 domain-containing protein [Solirubrobacteraceae bacterium]|jgi:hypothetical protein|nr:DUF4396 domain-containing protein [Solirubrobacteraceae bacterium]